MENEIEDVVLDDAIDKEEERETKTEAKKEFTPEEQLAIHKREAKKLEKQLGLSEPKSKQTKSEGLDYGQLAYLAAKGLDSEEDVSYLQGIVKETGRELKDVLSSKYVQAELKEMREARISADAIPKGTKRSSPNSVSDVDYWIAKDELPPDTAENRELRIKVVNERYNREKNSSPFRGGSNKIIIK